MLRPQAQNEAQMVIEWMPLKQMKQTVFTYGPQMLFEGWANRIGEQGFVSFGAETKIIVKLISAD